ncbi:hypothetical protein ATCC90586_002756 [Pythium insidiosum]|nr:hypothetical protein ATCC90586_002756 [Pythium insidiosum]
MPRYTTQQIVIRELEKALEVRERAAALRELYNDEDELEDDLDEKRDAKWQELLYDTVAVNDTDKDDEAFQPSDRRTFRGPAELDLMVLLKYLGSYGNDNTASKYAQFFGFGKGSTKNYIKRATRAILKLEDKVITWPDSDERRQISRRIREKYAFPNCVGVIDGTLLPLEAKPVVNGEDYYSRKGGYAVHTQIGALAE